MSRKRMALAVLVLSILFATGCRSKHVEVTVTNHTGSALRLLEVDYPSASFGADSMSSDGVLHYRIQLQGSGLIKVQYTAPDNSQPQMTGPSVFEGQRGRLEIILLPAGKAEFHPRLTLTGE
jgi:hypothetical protein